MNAEHTWSEFLAAVEQHTGKTFRHRADVEHLLTAAAGRSLEQIFADLVFHATFVVKTRDVMKRVGAGGEGFDILSTQFSEGLERVSTLLRTLIKEEQQSVKTIFQDRFFSMEQESLGRLLELLGDLALIKHWEVDGNPVPLPNYISTRKEHKTGKIDMKQQLQNLTRAARLALVLLIVLFIIDGPFTILGWVTALVVAGLLIVVQYEGAAAEKAASQS